VVFLVASLTDIVDGHLARQRGEVTRFGTLADPIADKVLTGVALVGLSILGELSWWVTGVLIGREVFVTLLRLWVIRHHVMAASWGGKAKTFALTVAIMLYVLPLEPHSALARTIMMAVAVILSLGTGIDYTIRALRVRHSGRNSTYDTSAVASDVIARLVARGDSVAVAESLTGGLVGATLTDVPGASAVFRGGVTAYATDLKAALLDVESALLSAGGAVQAEVAEQMATGVRVRAGSTYGLATTGVAGPEAQDGHPPGTVFVAVSGPRGARSVSLDLVGTRSEVRSQTVRCVLELLADEIATPSPP
jgi:CDP-diacylglycerol--glycerol-3-phosphate 3-phosphatidyltransferase